MNAKGLSIILTLSIAAGALGNAPVVEATISTRARTAIAPQSEPVKQTFKGKIMSQNGVRFILRDEQTDSWYHLDDQEKARKFLGKTVLIKGTLDGASGTIRIETIAEVSA